MKYMGSKSKIVKEIVPIIQERIRDNGLKKYYEPFVGGGNVISKVECENRYASDIQKYLIALYQNLDKIKDMPVRVSKEHYSDVRDCFNRGDDRYAEWYIGAIGFLASYNGRFFDGGYSGERVIADGSVRNYYDEAKRNLIAQIPLLKGVEFFCSDYRDVNDLEDYVIYCDPPYKGTKTYGMSKDFCYGEFWDWCREKSEKNIVLISEQEAPDDFECIWEQKSKRTINHAGTKHSVERLFEIRE